MKTLLPLSLLRGGLRAFTLLMVFAWCLLGATYGQTAVGEHELGAGDSVDIKVFQEPELDSAKVVISKEGNVSVQLIGEVNVLGLTAIQAARAIEAKFKKGFLVNPKVTVNVAGFAQKRFTVLGAVNKPGAYNLPQGQTLTVMEAIGMAGGFSKIANPSKIMIKRAGGGEPVRYDSKKGEGKAMEVKPGDVITIHEGFL